MATRWSIDEECWLAEMWQNVHEFHANEGPFWQVVTEKFNEQSDGPTRSKSQLMGKWARMNSDCQKFHEIYLNLQPTREPDDRVEDALNVYKERHDGRDFKYFQVWLILKSNTIWNRFIN